MFEAAMLGLAMSLHKHVKTTSGPSGPVLATCAARVN